ncbi:MAG TPA: polyprenyl synthetase family protein [Caldisericia bacterium]|nr:polyprenyl synthetase family protein [Caldisericia bacterium]HPF48766.1 polyprenyl synthetase family protein [Caldisericia bacterium]HPI83574.1 polyprenyl synthetase family protein [Caldisericia bacterium]HPQ93221.1 polyprenyl synthetase family protein [Caldisericia bacterium]HRV74946.1 polyprenyl synthetase family protein [Caldisericia bacterium]
MKKLQKPNSNGNSLTTLSTALRTYIRKVNDGLLAFLDDRTPDRLYDYVRYQVGMLDENLEPVKQIKGGKRIRSAIPMLVSKYLKIDDQAILGAISLEFFHNFTLIVDDIQDNDEIRRGKPSLWKLIGIPQALNAAMIAQSLAEEAARKACCHLPSKVAIDWLESNTRLTAKVFEGQYLDIMYEKAERVFTAQYIRMAMSKTACLFGQSFAQTFSLHPKEEVRKVATQMRAVGEAAGLAFQIQDDILGLWGDPVKTGKPVGADIRKHKKTLPIVHALESGSRSARKLILDSFSANVTDESAQTVLECLRQTGSFEFAHTQVRDYTNKALELLECADIYKELKERLWGIIEYLGGRGS